MKFNFIKQNFLEKMENCIEKNKQIDRELQNLKHKIAGLDNYIESLNIDIKILSIVSNLIDHKIFRKGFLGFDRDKVVLEKQGYRLKDHFSDGTIELWIREQCPFRESSQDDEE